MTDSSIDLLSRRLTVNTVVASTTDTP